MTRALHRVGIVWGDVKPENVLIDHHQNAWIVDFGGGFNSDFVDEAVMETVEGDHQGVSRIGEMLFGGTFVQTTEEQVEDASLVEFEGLRSCMVVKNYVERPHAVCPKSRDAGGAADVIRNRVDILNASTGHAITKFAPTVDNLDARFCHLGSPILHAI